MHANYPQERFVNQRGARLLQDGIVVGRSWQRWVS
jgi:hypothetical protein